MTNARYVSRVRVLTLLMVGVALVLVGRLYMLQIVNGSVYAARANAQFVEPSTPLTDRNSIYFTDKGGNQITAAALKDGFTLAINPQKVVNAEELYQSLVAYTPLQHDDFIAKANKKNSQYQVVGKRLPTELGLKIQKANYSGVVLANDRWRFYPGNELAAQTLGFVAYKTRKRAATGSSDIGRIPCAATTITCTATFLCSCLVA
jgi:cell division protein FtsI/penicillin-binding protein 2